MSIKLRKVGIIGTGHVGSHVAFSLATQGEADELYLMDIDTDKAHAQALDLNDAVSYVPHHVTATDGPIENCGDCDVLVISAGPLPAPNQDRLDTLGDTMEVLRDILPRIKASGFQGFIISISNPADVVATVIRNYLDYDPKKIISSGTALDSARLQHRLSDLFQVNRRSLQAYCLGEHGSSAMVPWSQVKVGGKPLSELQEELPERFPTFSGKDMLHSVVRGGYIVLQGKGSTEFGIACATTELIRAYFHDEHKVLPCSTYLDGLYDVKGIFASVPCIIGKNGVEEQIALQITDEELDAFHNSCNIIRQYVEKAGSI